MSSKNVARTWRVGPMRCRLVKRHRCWQGYITLPQNHPLAIHSMRGGAGREFTCGSYDDTVVGALDVTRIAENLAKELPK